MTSILLLIAFFVGIFMGCWYMRQNLGEEIAEIKCAKGRLARKLDAVIEVLDLEKYEDFSAIGEGHFFYHDNRDAIDRLHSKGINKEKLEQVDVALTALYKHLGLEAVKKPLVPAQWEVNKVAAPKK